MKPVGAMALLALALAALAVPTAQAQDVQGVAVLPGILADPVPFKGSAQFPITVDVGCAQVLAAMAEGMGPEATLTLSVQSPPSWLTVGEASQNVADQATAQGCLTGGSGRVTYD